MQNLLSDMGDYLKSRLLGVDDEVYHIQLAIAAGQHLSFIGPPGTGKTTLMGYAARCVSGTVFDKTFNATTVPDEVFGPLDVTALSGQNGPSEYKRLVTGFAPEANFLVLDEAGKAGSETLNGFLPMLDDRQEFQNGRTKIAVPLVLAIATSNEPLPDDCRALKDRFAMRLRCDYMSVSNEEALLTFSPAPMAVPSITIDQIRDIQKQVAAMTFDASCADAWGKVLRGLRAAGIPTSPRRLVQAKRVWQAAAWLAGATEVTATHIEALGCVLWTDLNHADAAIRICTMAASEHAERALEILDGAEAVLEEAQPNISAIMDGSIAPEDIGTVSSAQTSVTMFGQEIKALGTDPVITRCTSRIRDIWMELETARKHAVQRATQGFAGGF